MCPLQGLKTCRKPRLPPYRSPLLCRFEYLQRNNVGQMLWKCAPCPVHCRSTQESVEVAGSGSSSNVEPGDKDETWQNGHWQHMTLSPCSYHRPQLFWPYKKQSKQIVPKTQGLLTNFLANTCGHPLAAHASNNSGHSRISIYIYVLEVLGTWVPTPNRSQQYWLC